MDATAAKAPLSTITGTPGLRPMDAPSTAQAWRSAGKVRMAQWRFRLPLVFPRLRHATAHRLCSPRSGPKSLLCPSDAVAP